MSANSKQSENSVILDKNKTYASDLIPRIIPCLDVALGRVVKGVNFKGLVDMGVKHLSFGPPLGPDRLEAIQQIGAKVIPYFS